MTALVAAVLAGVAAALLTAPRIPLPSVTRSAAPRARDPLPTTALAAASAGMTALLLVPLPLGPLAAIAGAALTWRFVGRLEPSVLRRRRARLEAALPHVVDLMSTCLLAGGSPDGALSHILDAVEPPMRDELRAYVGRLGLGADPVSVWGAMARHPQLGPLGRALLRSAQSGASVADALERLATELRADRRASLEARARTIEVKASLPLGLCLLPAFVLVGIVPMIAGSFSLTFLDT